MLYLTSARRLDTLRKYNKTSLNSGHVNLVTKELDVCAGGGDERTQTDTTRKPNLTLYIILYYTHINNIPVLYETVWGKSRRSVTFSKVVVPRGQIITINTTSPFVCSFFLFRNFFHYPVFPSSALVTRAHRHQCIHHTCAF